MTKQKFTIEHPLKANSENLIWELISTADGLSKWMADNVELDGEQFTFTWGQPWRHSETRQAKILNMKKNKSIRLKWNDDDESDCYWEIAIEHFDLTGDCSLLITDFALKEDMDDQKELWFNSLEQLHRSSGL